MSEPLGLELCGKCHYDITHIQKDSDGSVMCPECGHNGLAIGRDTLLKQRRKSRDQMIVGVVLLFFVPICLVVVGALGVMLLVAINFP